MNQIKKSLGCRNAMRKPLVILNLNIPIQKFLKLSFYISYGFLLFSYGFLLCRLHFCQAQCWCDFWVCYLQTVTRLYCVCEVRFELNGSEERANKPSSGWKRPTPRRDADGDLARRQPARLSFRCSDRHPGNGFLQRARVGMLPLWLKCR